MTDICEKEDGAKEAPNMGEGGQVAHTLRPL